MSRFKEAIARAEHSVNAQGWQTSLRPVLWEVSIVEAIANVSKRCELSLPLVDSLCGLGVGSGVSAVVIVVTENAQRCAHLVATDGSELTLLRNRGSACVSTKSCEQHSREVWFLRRVVGTASLAFSDQYQLNTASPRETAVRTLATRVVTELIAADIDSSKSVRQAAVELLAHEVSQQDIKDLSESPSWCHARQRALETTRSQIQQATQSTSWASRSELLAKMSSLLWYDDELYGQRLVDETMSLAQCLQVLARLKDSGALPETLFCQLNGLLVGGI